MTTRLYIQQLTQANNKEITKVRIISLFLVESNADWGILLTKKQWHGKHFHAKTPRINVHSFFHRHSDCVGHDSMYCILLKDLEYVASTVYGRDTAGTLFIKNDHI